MENGFVSNFRNPEFYVWLIIFSHSGFMFCTNAAYLWLVNAINLDKQFLHKLQAPRMHFQKWQFLSKSLVVKYRTTQTYSNLCKFPLRISIPQEKWWTFIINNATEFCLLLRFCCLLNFKHLVCSRDLALKMCIRQSELQSWCHLSNSQVKRLNYKILSK